MHTSNKYERKYSLNISLEESLPFVNSVHYLTTEYTVICIKLSRLTCIHCIMFRCQEYLDLESETDSEERVKCSYQSTLNLVMTIIADCMLPLFIVSIFLPSPPPVLLPSPPPVLFPLQLFDENHSLFSLSDILA